MLKEELVWLSERLSPFQFIQALERWVNDYNNEDFVFNLEL